MKKHTKNKTKKKVKKNIKKKKYNKNPFKNHLLNFQTIIFLIINPMNSNTTFLSATSK